MTEHGPRDDPWRVATWEGATREAMRRWAQLPLERIIAAQEEMAALAAALRSQPAAAPPATCEPALPPAVGRGHAEWAPTDPDAIHEGTAEREAAEGASTVLPGGRPEGQDEFD